MKNQVTVKFNKKAVKEMSKDQFMKAHKSFSGIVNLEEEYLKINPKKEVTPTDTAKED